MSGRGYSSAGSRRAWIAVIGLAVASGLLWSAAHRAPVPIELSIERQEAAAATSAVVAAERAGREVRPDFLREKWAAERREEFQVTARRPTAIFVQTTGVQVRRESGWETIFEEPRNEIWRLKPGVVQQFFVERPATETGLGWRAFVRYGSEMSGPPLWRAQLREVWRTRSFSNWNGQAWGGGRFSGDRELFAEEVRE